LKVELFTLRRSHARARRGFSLVELLAVVTITAILATAGIAMFRRHVIASRGGEVTGVLEGLSAAEKMYMAENRSYLDVSQAAGGKQWYPQVKPPNHRVNWVNDQHLDYDRWRQLPMPLNRQVMFSYLANAGTPNTAMTPLASDFKDPPTFPVPQLDWFVLQAKGDTDGNGVYALYATTNVTSEIYSENAGD